VILPILFLLFIQGSAGARGPNVVLIMTDDQGYGDMSCHGNPYLKTPHIDQLYRESVRLADFHVDPTCSPTRASLMTGRSSSRAGVWLTYGGRHHLRADEVTMADLFAASGYRTAIFGKWHLGDNYLRSARRIAGFTSRSFTAEAWWAKRRTGGATITTTTPTSATSMRDAGHVRWARVSDPAHVLTAGLLKRGDLRSEVSARSETCAERAPKSYMVI
jgi:arylsulfatase A-like enzyme